MRLTLALLLLGGCVTDPPPVPPDATCVASSPGKPGVEAWFDDNPPLPFCAAAAIIYTEALTVCPEIQKTWCVNATFEVYPIENCYGWTRPGGYGGCQNPLDACDVLIGWKPEIAATALPDETGHLVWETCFDRTGETQYDDGGITYDPDFAAWVSQVRIDIATNVPNVNVDADAGPS